MLSLLKTLRGSIASSAPDVQDEAGEAKPDPSAYQRDVILVLLLTLAAAAWAVLVWHHPGVDMDMRMASPATLGLRGILFLTMWVVMMVAMMFPATAPMFLAFHKVQAAKLQAINSKLASRITNGMSRVWKEVQNHNVRDPGPPEAHWEYRLRKKLLLPLVTGWKFYIAPAVFALAIFYVVFAFSSHALFNVLDVRGHTCIDTPGKINFVPDKGALISFHSSELCHASTLKVHRGTKYLVSVNPGAKELAHYPGYTALPSALCDSRPVEVLADGDQTTTLSGYATFENVIENLSHTIAHFFLLPLRRELDRPWFQLVLRYGRVRGEEGFVDPDPDPTVTELSTEIRPPVERELFTFVNDAVISVPPRWFDAFYRDNKGCIRVLIKPR